MVGGLKIIDQDALSPLIALKEVHLGHRVSERIVVGRVLGWVVGVYNLFGPVAVAPLTASKEARLGHRASECIVDVRVWGLVGGC